MKKYRAISLFSGCGGSDLALHRTGFEVIWANDILETACKTYSDNIPKSKIEQGDIRDFNRFPDAELLVGCYPCQGFSQGGRRNAKDNVNFLYREFDRVLRAVRPEAFVVENVSGMRFGENSILLNNQLKRYRTAGYKVNWNILDAKDFSVAQNRRRIFIVGIRSDLNKQYEFPRPTHGPGTGKKYVTQRDSIGKLDFWPMDGFCKEPFHWYYLSRNRRKNWDEPSACIVGHWRHVPLHPESCPLMRVGPDKWKFSKKGRSRRFTFEECAMLQGFPNSWKWNHGSFQNRFQLIGNAVPPPLFEAVLRAIPTN